MSERVIAEDEILSIVNHKVDIIIIPSDRDPEIDLYFGKINKKYLLVVANKITLNLITVRNMNKKEKKIFDEELTDEE
jgi:hypothetical protein